MKKLLLFVLLPFHLFAQNWSEHIAPIFYSKCVQCHHQGGIAPTSYIDYWDAAASAASIRVKVQQRKMPPWPPDPAYSRFAHERFLSQQEIDDISNWVQQGAPQGDSTLAPAPPVFNGTATLLNPDLTLTIPNYTISSTSGDIYRCFVLPTGIATQRFITDMEVLPGNLSAVHHVLVFSDTSSTPAQLDAQDPAPGYTNFGGTGSSSSNLLGVWAPGGGAYHFPSGMGMKLPANTNIILQIHYPSGANGMTDNTQIRFKLTTSPFTREVFISAPLNHLQLDNGPLVIAPNATPVFTAHYTLPINITALAVAPHMHLIGRSITSYGVTPANDTIPFVHIPSWDFHWQGMYSFPRLLKLPSGTTLYSSASYDNTLNNPFNPNDPPRWVTLGEATTDEMMLVYFTYTYYFPGDENIIQDSAFFAGVQPIDDGGLVKSPQLYDPWPNPAVDKLGIQYMLPSPATVELELCDVTGRVVKKIEQSGEQPAGLISLQVDVAAIASGNYLLVLKSKGTVRSKAVIIGSH